MERHKKVVRNRVSEKHNFRGPKKKVKDWELICVLHFTSEGQLKQKLMLFIRNIPSACKNISYFL